jgi:hypothetical protein
MTDHELGEYHACRLMNVSHNVFRYERKQLDGQ